MTSYRTVPGMILVQKSNAELSSSQKSDIANQSIALRRSFTNDQLAVLKFVYELRNLVYGDICGYKKVNCEMTTGGEGLGDANISCSKSIVCSIQLNSIQTTYFIPK